MHDDALGAALLALARGTIEAQFGREFVGPRHDALEREGATFVTLKHEGALRGCIGTLEPVRALRDDVAHNALAAAFSDPRFDPLRHAELGGLCVEVSLLGPCEEVVCRDEEHLLAQLRPGVDGLVLRYGRRRGTFLPQVWDAVPEPRRFLRELKHKAGLPGDFWHPDIAIARYEVAKWSEAEEVTR